MGLDPKFPDYEAGVDCAICKSVIFNGVTPKYIEVHVSGVVACPLFPVPQPNGVFLITQTGLPCNWVLAGPTFSVSLTFGIGQSGFGIQAGGLVFFFSLILLPCQTVFTNQSNCANPATAGSGGTASLFWGPTIDPEP